MDFTAIRMAYEGGTEMIIFSAKMTRPWDEVFEVIKKLSASKVTFKYTLISVDEMEST